MKHPPKPPRHNLRDLGPIIRRQPAVFAVYLVLRLIVIGTLVSSIIRQEYESAFICLLVLVLFMLPFFIQQNFGIELYKSITYIAGKTMASTICGASCPVIITSRADTPDSKYYSILLAVLRCLKA